MSIERLLQYSVAAMAALGTLLLGMGSDNVVLPVLAIIVAASSLYVTDLRRWVELNRNVANLAAIGAVFIAVFDFFQLGRERQLLAIAYLLIYLQIVLMYQRKDIRVYWQLLMLSLLQVVVASALNFDLRFGFLLTLYMFFGLFALSVFYVFRQHVRHELAHSESPAPGKKSGVNSSANRETLVRQNEIYVAGETEAPGNKVFQRALQLRVLLQGLATLALTFVAFLLLPRSGEINQLRGVASSRLTGYANEVRVGELGPTLQNQAPVMRLWLLDAKTKRPFRVHGEPLLRGTALNDYNIENRRWSQRMPSGMSADYTHNYSEDLDLPRSPRNATLQRIKLEPLNVSTVFAIYPAFSLGDPLPINFNREKQQLLRKDDTEAWLDFTIATTGIRHGIQSEFLPTWRGFDRQVEGYESQAARRLLKPFVFNSGNQASEARLQPIRELADQIILDSGLPEDDYVGRARALEKYLHNNSRFQYSLDATQRNPELDPFVDFLTEHPQGHCEYFAGALTLMLRSQKIKSRLVNGFKGGKWNSLGNYYQIRQSDAHSWTEAYIPRGKMPGTSSGGWLRLDPTPGTAAADDEEKETFGSTYQEWANYGEFLWANYVIELDAQRQQEGIYAPLAEIIDFLKTLITPEFWHTQLPKYVAYQLQSASSYWIGWNAVLLALLAFLTACVLFLIARIIFRRMRKAPQQQSRIARRTQVVEFYRQFESLLRRHGLDRPEYQTQREFAVAIGGQLAQKPGLRQVAVLPRKIVDAYYRICYGNETIGPAELITIQNALHQLAAALKETRTEGTMQ